jgi:hypothetical protein
MGSGTRPGEVVLKLGKTGRIIAIPTNETYTYYKETGDKHIFDIRVPVSS